MLTSEGINEQEKNRQSKRSVFIEFGKVLKNSVINFATWFKYCKDISLVAIAIWLRSMDWERENNKSAGSRIGLVFA